MIRIIYPQAIAEEAYLENNFFPSFDGILSKKGHVVHNWKSRWFVLHRKHLSYFRSPKDSDPRGRIDMSMVTNIQVLAKDCRSNSFLIETETKSYICVAPSSDELDQWVKILKVAQGFWNNWEVSLQHDQKYLE